MNSIRQEKPASHNLFRHGSMGLVMLVIATAGCQSPSASWSKAMHPFGKKAAKAKDAESAIGVPQRMVVIWKDSVYESPTDPPTRGFGGRFYFYDQHDQPIRVDGELVVYGFDDTSGNQRDEADKKFVFRQENLANHYGQTPLGHSYSVWVPWDKMGNPEASICLIPVFRTGSGEIVRGDHTVAVLGGPNSKDREFVDSVKPSDPVQELNSTPGVQHIATGDEITRMAKNQTIAHVQQVESSSVMQKAGAKIRTTTISLPDDTAMRLQQASRRLTIPKSGSSSESNSGLAVDEMPVAAVRPTVTAEPSTASLSERPSSAETIAPQTREANRGVFGSPGSLK